MHKHGQVEHGLLAPIYLSLSSTQIVQSYSSFFTSSFLAPETIQPRWVRANRGKESCTLTARKQEGEQKNRPVLACSGGAGIASAEDDMFCDLLR